MKNATAKCQTKTKKRKEGDNRDRLFIYLLIYLFICLFILYLSSDTNITSKYLQKELKQKSNFLL